ncbi:hypothetical protein CYMTET_20765 [Cymbomonas tetramitiformis]|uniref:BZIP domain-containing protein n=1 Tax=Cymbomonas tetramitiformis TaxID=36881 RepID=A0AAE0G447_9CHLO|nr:hypothetical protein CYMTET_20765 [Cymbomonas tetramitiformis]
MDNSSVSTEVPSSAPPTVQAAMPESIPNAMPVTAATENPSTSLGTDDMLAQKLKRREANRLAQARCRANKKARQMNTGGAPPESAASPSPSIQTTPKHVVQPALTPTQQQIVGAAALDSPLSTASPIDPKGNVSELLKVSAALVGEKSVDQASALAAVASGEPKGEDTHEAKPAIEVGAPSIASPLVQRAQNPPSKISSKNDLDTVLEELRKHQKTSYNPVKNTPEWTDLKDKLSEDIIRHEAHSVLTDALGEDGSLSPSMDSSAADAPQAPSNDCPAESQAATELTTS